MSVKFIGEINGKEAEFIVNSKLIGIPGTGDIIEGAMPTDPKFQVESVTHKNIFNSPGEHEVVVKVKKL